jgi:hypothetical protein
MRWRCVVYLHGHWIGDTDSERGFLLQISGIEGTFRITSEAVMRVLRENRESIMAVLEAFVHDPLINWRLINWRLEPSKSKENLFEGYYRGRRLIVDISGGRRMRDTGHSNREFFFPSLKLDIYSNNAWVYSSRKSRWTATKGRRDEPFGW